MKEEIFVSVIISTITKFVEIFGLPRWWWFNEPAWQGREHIRDEGSIPQLGRSPGGEYGNPFQHRVTKSRTLLKWLSTHHRLYLEHILFSINYSWMIVPNISLPFLQLPHSGAWGGGQTIWLIMMLDVVFDFAIILCLIQDLEI